MPGDDDTSAKVRPTTTIEPTTEYFATNNTGSSSAHTERSCVQGAGKIDRARPAVVYCDFPIFATPTTVRTAAPPPPAPVLKMGIDLSKFLKKPASKQHNKKAEAGSGLDRFNVKKGPAPKINPLLDIRTKRHEERTLLAHGPKIQIKLGEVFLGTVPKYAFMQCSSKGFKHFTKSPDANPLTLPAGSMNAEAASAHITWMREMTYQSRVYSITLHSDEKFDDKNLQTCRAARVLGLNNMYVGHFTKLFCDRIRSNSASYEFMSKVATLAYPENDPIYDCLINNLANLRMHNAFQKHVELEAFLEKHTSIKSRVEKIQERMRKQQFGHKGPNETKFVRVGKKMGV